LRNEIEKEKQGSQSLSVPIEKLQKDSETLKKIRDLLLVEDSEFIMVSPRSQQPTRTQTQTQTQAQQREQQSGGGFFGGLFGGTISKPKPVVKSITHYRTRPQTAYVKKRTSFFCSKSQLSSPSYVVKVFSPRETINHAERKLEDPTLVEIEFIPKETGELYIQFVHNDGLTIDQALVKVESVPPVQIYFEKTSQMADYLYTYVVNTLKNTFTEFRYVDKKR